MYNIIFPVPPGHETRGDRMVTGATVFRARVRLLPTRSGARQLLQGIRIVVHGKYNVPTLLLFQN